MNAYFQILNGDSETKLKLFPATDDGLPINMNELINYLTFHQISYQISELNAAVSGLKEETTITLNQEKILPIQEELYISITDENMKAVGRFVPPSSASVVMNKDDILSSLKRYGIVYGIQMETIDRFLAERTYLTDIVLAEGTQPVQGKDAEIEYFFNTDLKARPTLLEDGSVDFFHLNIINHCDKGDLLARLHPEDPGESGCDIMGTKIKPRSVKHTVLRYGHNIDISEDKTELYAADNGHVTLVDGRVFVSTLMELENVDTSTGDIEFEGNVQVNGNVCSNFKIHAKGNVEVRGIVEGAEIISGGNITIARGMNGMGKGVLKAKGNIVAQFIENSSAQADGYIEAGSLIHSTVMAGTEIHVNGKKGFISGGHVSATTLIDAKILGSEMGTVTVAEIGISPVTKREYKELGEALIEDRKVVERAIPILEAARDKYQAGKELSEAQIENVRELAKVVKTKREEIATKSARMEELGLLIEVERESQIIVRGTVYPGTKIVISDVSKIIKESMQYCRFVKYQGDVKMVGM